mmetsp:Transcript_121772/g.279040  ORF Transcript_121772/g.279040 Transcript_121772/m.279040 type:complete len:426 (-) Transcript_121772:287-1564(-)
MMMDLFYMCAAKHVTRCSRFHFHEFMYMVHKMMHEAKSQPGRRPVDVVCERIAQEVGTLLCFDEFAITTIQDCCLLAPLFDTLWQNGVTTISTSNRAPENLYQDGLNRHLYLPAFLEVLDANCKVVHLPVATDYRAEHVARSGLAADPVFSEGGDSEFASQWWQRVTGGSPIRREVFVGGYGRELEVTAANGVARTSFAEMCAQPRSVDDYLALCKQYHTLIVDDIPVLQVDDHNEARRFTNLVDAAYESHTRLIASFQGTVSQVLESISPLRDVGLESVGNSAGCGDGDTSPSSSGVLAAVQRMKEAVEKGPEVLRKEAVSHVYSPHHQEQVQGKDMEIWHQDGDLRTPQVSRSWDDRRRASQFSWEASDPTAEQQSVKGVFAAAIASLRETGFASERTRSRMMEMQSNAYLEEWALKRGGARD